MLQFFLSFLDDVRHLDVLTERSNAQSQPCVTDCPFRQDDLLHKAAGRWPEPSPRRDRTERSGEFEEDGRSKRPTVWYDEIAVVLPLTTDEDRDANEALEA